MPRALVISESVLGQKRSQWLRCYRVTLNWWLTSIQWLLIIRFPAFKSLRQEATAPEGHRRSTYKTLRSPVRLPLLLSPSCPGTQPLVQRNARLGGKYVQRPHDIPVLAQGRGYVSPSFSLHIRSHAVVPRPLFLCYTHVLRSVCLLATGFPKRLRHFFRRHQISISN